MKSHVILTVACALLVMTTACRRETGGEPEKSSTAGSPASGQKAQPRSGGGTTAPSTEVGALMPAYTGQYLDGSRFDLSGEKGSVVLLNVWATWCQPCLFEIPELQSIQNEYSKRDMKVIGVSIDETGVEPVKQFVAERKMTYPIAIDADQRIANLLQTTVLPTSLLIDRKGRIVWRQVGALMPNDPKLKSAIKAAVEQPKG